MVIVRNGESLVAPKAAVTLSAGDTLLCFATDEEIERFKAVVATSSDAVDAGEAPAAYALRRLKVRSGSRWSGVTIRAAGIREAFDSIVVGLERKTLQIRSPSPDTVLAPDDVLWIVGNQERLSKLAGEF